MRKLLSILTALSLFIPTIAVIADDPSATTEPEKEIRVVGKRITGDDTYFEISLELDRDYEEYSAVGVVLEYDPTVIWPAESWDDGAGKADMDGIDSWSTRRALPTLGKDTWTTHTALTYIRPKDETDPDNIIPAKGYLYLGAEYPGTMPNTVDPSATTDPAATPAATPETTPAASPAEETETDPYSNPIVVARFMYVGDDPAATKAALVSAWETGANVTPTAETWDKHWQQNEILTLAGDDIAEKSPGEYAGAVYFADYSKKVYMHTFPSPAPTAAPESTLAPGATPTPLPTFAPYTPPAVGSGLTADEKLTADKIEIVTGEGESAKAGGLKLSDIYVILFFDWDDSLLGTLTAGVGQDPTESVHNYVKNKFIHPQLRDLDYASMTDAEKKLRKNNYRGEYPENGPNSSDPLAKSGAYGAGSAQPGANYPLTNKLDYAFAGKNLLDEDHPYTFAYGWTQVLPTSIDYAAENAAATAAGDPLPYPGVLPQVLPKGLSDSITWEQEYTLHQTYGWCPDVDPDTGVLVDSTATIPTIMACDLSKITAEDLKASDGNLYLKAAYMACEWLGRNPSGGAANLYSIRGQNNGSYTLNPVGPTVGNTTTYGIGYGYERINQYGHGCTRPLKPVVKMDIKQNKADSETPIQILVDNTEYIDVLLTPTNHVATVGYTLKDAYGANAITGAQRSELNGFDTEHTGSNKQPIKLSGSEGLFFKEEFKTFLEKVKAKVDAETSTGTPYKYAANWINATEFKNVKLVYGSTATATTAISGNAKIRSSQKGLVDLVRYILSIGKTLDDISWYQAQYYVINTTGQTVTVDYISSDDAKTWLETNHPNVIANFRTLDE